MGNANTLLAIEEDSCTLTCAEIWRCREVLRVAQGWMKSSIARQSQLYQFRYTLHGEGAVRFLDQRV